MLRDYDPGPARLGTFFASFALGTQNETAHFANENGELVFAATTVGLDNKAVLGVFTTLHAVDPEAPVVTSASVVDGKLVVTGEGFARGDRIVVGTRRFENTKPDRASPTTTLTSKTADGALLPDAPTPVSVIDKHGHQSAAFAAGPFQ